LLFLEAHKEIFFNITKCNVSKYLLETKLKFEIVQKKQKPHQWWRCNLTKNHHNYKSKGTKPLQDEHSNRTKPQSKDDRIFGVKSSKLWLWLEQKYKEKIMNSKTQLSLEASFRSLTSRVFNKKKKLLEYKSHDMV